jgi:hypothetical protein
MNLEKMSNEELLKYKRDLEYEVVKFNTLQATKKVCL